MRLLSVASAAVVADDQQRWVDAGLEEGRLAAGRGCGRGLEGQGTCRHVATEDFVAVQVHDSAVVAEQAEGQRLESRRVGYCEVVAEVCGDVLLEFVRPEVDKRRFVAIPVTELGLARQPARIIKVESSPRRPLIRPIVQELPRGTGQYQRDHVISQDGVILNRNLKLVLPAALDWADATVPDLNKVGSRFRKSVFQIRI